MSRLHTDRIGSIGWTESTGGVLTARECLTLARPLLRGELDILAGRLAMALRIHSGRRSSIDPASLAPPDSALARDAEVAAQMFHDTGIPSAIHHTPGVGLESGAEAYLLSAGVSVDVFGLHSNEIPDAVRQSVVDEYPRLGFKREFAGLLRAEAKQVPRGRARYLHRFALSDVSIRLAPFRG